MIQKGLMMIIQEKVKMNICANNIKYWIKNGYDVKINSEIEVNTIDLPPKSNKQILCKCNNCEGNYLQRFSRDKEICGSCRTSSRMKGNNNGTNNKNKKILDKDDLENDLISGLNKSKIAKKYNTSIGVINRLFKEYSIELVPYYGTLFFKTTEEEQKAISDINSCNDKMNISEISKKTGIPRQIIGMLRKKKNVNVKTQIDYFKEVYDKIMGNFEYYEKLNKTLTLKEISNKENISIDHLKRAFKESGKNVILHSFNKSKGEKECKEYINGLGVICNSVMLNKIYEIDCFVMNKRFGVEYCGEYWHRFDPLKSNKNYHKNKFEFCEGNNINLMTIFEC